MLVFKQFLATHAITVLFLDDHAADAWDLHVQSIAHGVITLEQVESDYGSDHGILGHMNSPVDLTYLADTVILLRYFEQEGSIKKVVSVIKKRIGAHEDTIREFRLDKGGLRVGDPLRKFHGVLTGTPIFKGDMSKMIPEAKV